METVMEAVKEARAHETSKVGTLVIYTSVNAIGYMRTSKDLSTESCPVPH